mmetsp:Transcript_41723/g.54945  ORF Transcript_41723/g.54945 Transcript_41723/m.54945 type:complete len:188 (-) Transcript_41723:9-572(-)
MNKIFLVEGEELVVNGLEAGVSLGAEGKDGNFIDPLDYVSAAPLQQAYVLAQHGLVMARRLLEQHSGLFERVLCQHELLLEKVEGNALVEVFLAGQRLLQQRFTPEAAVLDELEAVFDGESPENAAGDYEGDQPEVGGEKRELAFAILELDCVGPLLAEEVVLQDGRLPMHEQEADDVEEQNVFVPV